MTAQQFIAKWGPGGSAYELNERQGAQQHFIELCQLLGVASPGSSGDYLFEQNTVLKQLLSYSLVLSKPPLLAVSLLDEGFYIPSGLKLGSRMAQA